MRKCAFCKRRYVKGSKTSFHRFPEDSAMRNIWLQNMKAINWTPKKNDSLCSEHFEVKYVVKHCNRAKLMLGSVPTIFEGSFADPNSGEELSNSENDSSGKDNIVKELKPAVFNDPCKPAISTTLTTPGTSKNSLLMHQSQRHCGVKREFSKSPSVLKLKHNTYQKNANATDGHYYNAVSATLNKSRIEYGLTHDHRYENSLKSSKKADERTNDEALQRSLKLSKARVKVLTQHVKRLKTKVTSLKAVVNDLTKRNKASKEYTQLLKQYDKLQMDLSNRMLKNTENERFNHDEYPPQLRAFAITLYFYSPKAYTYVKKKFNLSLPHPKVIRSWYRTVNVKNQDPPDFSQVFCSLKHESQISENNGEKLFSAHNLHEMSIKKESERDCDSVIREDEDIDADDPSELPEYLLF